MNIRQKGPPTSACRKGAFHCSFCDESFTTQRGQVHHEWNKHPIRLSKLLANLASQPDDEEEEQAEMVSNSIDNSSQSTHWPIHLTNCLIRAMISVGCSSDIALVKAMEVDKTAHQVGKVKRWILSQYPETFIYLRETVSQEARCEEMESDWRKLVMDQPYHQTTRREREHRRRK